MSGLTAVGFFIVSLFFSLLIISLWLRIAIRYLRISSLTPLSQLIFKVTNPLVNPILQITKYKYQAGQQLDQPALITLVVVEFTKLLCISLLAFQAIMPLGYLLLYVLADFIIQPCDILFFAILVRVIMSFVNPAWMGPTTDFVYALTEPPLQYVRKLIPVTAGFDFSPFIILVVLKVITLFISGSLPWRLL